MHEFLHEGLRNMRRTADRSDRTGLLRVVFIAPKQANYQSLCNATQGHFQDAEVFLVDRLPDTHNPDHTVCLVLLGASPQMVSLALVEECLRHFPTAAIAVAVENGLPIIEPVLIERRLVQGILPTTLPLDVWLALVQLVIAGGEYLPQDGAWPAGHFESAQRVAPAVPRGSSHYGGAIDGVAGAVAPTRHGPDNDGEAENGLDALTARECEILTLVSAGFQNKLIAVRMGLSEHTVKAHVHNLIAKLRVTNRTQAAAYLHEHKFDKKPDETGRGDPSQATAPG